MLLCSFHFFENEEIKNFHSLTDKCLFYFVKCIPSIMVFLTGVSFCTEIFNASQFLLCSLIVLVKTPYVNF